MYKNTIPNFIREGEKFRQASLVMDYLHYDNHPRTNTDDYWIGRWKGVRSDELLKLLNNNDFLELTEKVINNSPIAGARLTKSNGLLSFNSIKDKDFSDPIQLSANSDYIAVVNLTTVKPMKLTRYIPREGAEFKLTAIKDFEPTYPYEKEEFTLNFNDALIIEADSVISFEKSYAESIEEGSLYALIFIKKVKEKTW